MMEFHYDKIAKKYDYRLRLLMTDTDHIPVETPNVYQVMLDDFDAYDTSEIHQAIQHIEKQTEKSWVK